MTDLRVVMLKKIFAFLLFAAIVSTNNSVVAQTDLSSKQQVTIHGKDFYKDGKLWLPKGIKIEGFNEPAGLRAKSKIATEARSYWGTSELDAIRRVFNADVIRFAVSQPGLDPQSPIYDQQYVIELLDAIKLARSAGFVVIPSMDAQGENGIPNLPCMPNDSTKRSWQILAPSLIHDQGVMFELSDEPCKSSNAENQKEWSQEMQSLVDAVRGLGSTNILLLDGLWYARSTNGLFPLVHDTLPNRLALAVHPYLVSKDFFVTEKQWHDQFGASAEKYPVIASEWNATSTNGCIGDTTPTVALSLMRYLESLHLGLIGWAIDSHSGKLVKDHISYEPTDYSSFAGCTKTPSESGGGRLLASYPND